MDAKCAALFLCPCLVAAGLQAEVLKVPNERYPTIQSALDAAQDGDTVVVGPGEYSIQSALDFNRLRDPERAVKNLTLRSVAGAERTTIRMQADPALAGNHSVLYFHSGEGAESLVEGFTLTGGQGTDAACGLCFPSGGAVFLTQQSAVTLKDCILTENAAEYGGGLQCDLGCSAALIDCTLRANVSRQEGGAIHCGGGSSVVLKRCRISGNLSRTGGGIACDAGASASLENCLVTGNAAVLGGPGDFRSRLWGGAFFLESSARLDLLHCTVADNGAADGPEMFIEPGSAAVITNSIIWDLAASPFYLGSQRASVTATYSDIQGQAVWAGEGNILAAPGFVKAGFFEAGIWHDGDYRLLSTSPCIDRGLVAAAPPTDLNGSRRPCGGGVDLGAYESGDCPALRKFIRGDCNGDGGTGGVADALAMLVSHFIGGVESRCRSACDANGDGMLDGTTDAVTILTHNFLGGATIPEPFPSCGPASLPSDAQLGCEASPGCDA